MSTNTKQLKYVIVLARCESFHKAAEELGISQPSLSQYIKNIEKQVGMDLFERTNGKVKLTDAGNIYIECGKKILNLEHLMETKFSDLAENKTGSIIIGAAPYRSAYIMPEITKHFKKKYSGIHLIIHEGLTCELNESMANGDFDICLMTLPINEELFDFEIIMEEEMVLAVPGSMKTIDSSREEGRKYPVIDITEINGADFVMLTEEQVMQRTLKNTCKKYSINLNKAAVVSSLEAQMNMVKAGVGMALMPTGMSCFCKDKDVQFYSFRQELPNRKIVAMWRKDKALSKAMLDLIGIMKSLEN